RDVRMDVVDPLVEGGCQRAPGAERGLRVDEEREGRCRETDRGAALEQLTAIEAASAGLVTKGVELVLVTHVASLVVAKAPSLSGEAFAINGLDQFMLGLHGFCHVRRRLEGLRGG